MPQIRLAESSIVVAESDSYLDLVVVAQVIGLEVVVFDDVGLGFDVTEAIAEDDRRRAEIDTSGIEDQDLLDEISSNIAAAQAHHDNLVGPIAQSVVDLIAQADPTAVPIVVGTITRTHLPVEPSS